MIKKEKKFSSPRWNNTAMPIKVGEARELTEKDLEILKKLEEFAKRDINKHIK